MIPLPQQSVPTISPAMDIQLPYNFERFLHCLLGGSSGNALASSTLVPLLQIHTNGTRLLPSAITKKIKEAGVVAMVVDDEKTLMTVKKYWDKYRYCLDPHSAIGVYAAEKYQQSQKKGNMSAMLSTMTDVGRAVRCVAVCTAHPR